MSHLEREGQSEDSREVSRRWFLLLMASASTSALAAHISNRLGLSRPFAPQSEKGKTGLFAVLFSKLKEKQANEFFDSEAWANNRLLGSMERGLNQREAITIRYSPGGNLVGEEKALVLVSPDSRFGVLLSAGVNQEGVSFIGQKHYNFAEAFVLDLKGGQAWTVRFQDGQPFRSASYQPKITRGDISSWEVGYLFQALGNPPEDKGWPGLLAEVINQSVPDRRLTGLIVERLYCLDSEETSRTPQSPSVFRNA